MTSVNRLFWSVSIPLIVLMQVGPGFGQTISQAMTQAKKEQRQLMLYFTSKPCSKCKALDTYFDQEHIQNALLENYVVVKVDIDDFDGRACREIYDVDEVPALVVVDLNGKIVYKAQGDLTQEDVEPIVETGNLPETNKKRSVTASKASKSNRHAQRSDPLFAIQIGYFSSAENADKLKDKVASQGYDHTQVREEQKKNKTYYRVLVGDYEGADIAQTDLKRLKNSGFSVKMHKYRP